jgi:hypothetical protein
MRSIILVCFLLFAAISSAQNVSGIWRGRFQNTNPLMQQPPYKYELLLFQNGDSLTGFSYSTSGTGDYYAVCTVNGKVFDGYMVAKEIKTIYDNSVIKTEGILQTHILFFGSDNNEATGEWKQNNPRKFQLMLEEGRTFVKKETDPKKSELLKVLEQEKMIAVEPESKPDTPVAPLPVPVTVSPAPANNKDSVKLAGRAKEIVKTIEISADSVLLELYDDSIVDGDSVSIFLNNKLLLGNIALTEKGIQQRISLPKNSEGVLISMYAENQGTIPPNTGLLIIRDKGLKQEIRFTSSTKKTAAVLLKRK